jgi:hypothetical protein
MKEGPNFYTNPAKKGSMRAVPGILFGNFKWEKDEYNRNRLHNKKLKEEKLKKRMKNSEKPFLNMHFGREPLCSAKQVLYCDKKNLCKVGS